MAENDYGGSFGEGQSGQGFSGGNSIDYAGYMAGRESAFQAELSRGGSGVGAGGALGGGAPVFAPMNVAQKAMRVGVVFALLGLPLGALWQSSILGAVAGVVGGFTVGLLLRFGAEAVAWPVKKLIGTAAFLPAMALGFAVGTLLGGPGAGVAGAGVVLVLWLVRRRRTA